jgi:hypothetical protein
MFYTASRRDLFVLGIMTIILMSVAAIAPSYVTSEAANDGALWTYGR